MVRPLSEAHSLWTGEPTCMTNPSTSRKTQIVSSLLNYSVGTYGQEMKDSGLRPG
jgi:hypothetical protein